MAARKESLKNTSHYNVSMDKSDFHKKSNNYLGNCISNFLGTVFNVWDNGLRANKAKSLDE